MSDASQGPDWWRASDGMWYPPELHPDYVTRRVPGPTRSAPSSPRTPTARAHSGVGAPVLSDPRRSAGAPSGLRSPPSPFIALRVVSLAALVLSIVGVNMPWATTDAALSGLRTSVTGIGLGTGRLLCGVLAVVLVLSWWHLAATSRRTGVLLFASWLGALALSVYEIVDVIAVPTRGLFTLNIGVGLYLCGFAALVACVCSLADLAQLCSAAHPVGPANPGVVWAGGLVALAVVAAAAAFAGYRAAASPVGPIPALSPDQPFDNGTGGPPPGGDGSTGGTGSGSTGGTGSGSTGGTGSTGNSGNFGGSGNSGNSGTTGSTGNSGNSGPGGGLGNSGSGNSGPDFFGNSGPGLFGPGQFGNT